MELFVGLRRGTFYIDVRICLDLLKVNRSGTTLRVFWAQGYYGDFKTNEKEDMQSIVSNILLPSYGRYRLITYSNNN